MNKVILCAEAIGKVPNASARETYQGVPVGVWLQCHEYNPLTNDAQAMELIEKLGLMLTRDAVTKSRGCMAGPRCEHTRWNADLKTAIVECVAAMQEEKNLIAKFDEAMEQAREIVAREDDYVVDSAAYRNILKAFVAYHEKGE